MSVAINPHNNKTLYYTRIINSDLIKLLNLRNKGLILIPILFWSILIENNIESGGVLFNIGGGFEIRISLVVKIIISILMFGKMQSKILLFLKLKYLFIFQAYLILSSLYVLFIHPQYFQNAIAVTLHVVLGLNILAYIYISKSTISDLNWLSNSLRNFAMINATLVIISYFFPNLIMMFETSSGDSNITRAFGIMGDEIALFLTYFLFESLIFKRIWPFILFSFTLLLTGGIGASITAICLILYYYFIIRKVHRKNIVGIIFKILFFCFLLFLTSNHLKGITVIKRGLVNITNPDQGTGKLRLLSITTGLENFSVRPLLGTGYGSYGYYIKGSYDKLNDVPINILSSTFNPFLQIINESGLLGLVFFILLLRFFLKIVKDGGIKKGLILTYPLKMATYGWLIVFFVTSQTANWLLPNSFLLLLIVILVGINAKLNLHFNAILPK